MAISTMGNKADFSCERVGECLVVTVRGEIDHHTAVAIRNGIDAVLFDTRPSHLRLDLSQVGFMDSSGLGLIMGRFSVMRELGGTLAVWDPSPETAKILALAGMERIVSIEYPEGKEPVTKKSPSRPQPSSASPRRRSTQRTRRKEKQA